MNRRPGWHRDAACRDGDAERFFPARGASTKPATVACRSCPVRALCLDDAIRRDEKYGIYGGLTRPQRLRVARRQLAERSDAA